MEHRWLTVADVGTVMDKIPTDKPAAPLVFSAYWPMVVLVVGAGDLSILARDLIKRVEPEERVVLLPVELTIQSATPVK